MSARGRTVGLFGASMVLNGVMSLITIPIVIWGDIFLGIATATEVAALAVLAAFIIGVFIYRELPTSDTIRVIKDSAGQTAVVMLIVASSAVLGWYLTSEQIPQKFARAILETTSNKYLILFFLNIFFFIAGMFLHSAAAIILLVVLLVPLLLYERLQKRQLEQGR